MKTYLATAVATALLCLSTLALAMPSDTVVLENKKGAVTFNHKQHSESFACATCHGDGEPAKLELDMKSAHALCKTCHQEKNGPTKCNDCHNK